MSVNMNVYLLFYNEKRIPWEAVPGPNLHRVGSQRWCIATRRHESRRCASPRSAGTSVREKCKLTSANGFKLGISHCFDVLSKRSLLLFTFNKNHVCVYVSNFHDDGSPICIFSLYFYQRYGYVLIQALSRVP